MLIVLMPIGLLALLGVRLAQDEQRRVDDQLRALMRARLHDVGRSCMAVVHSTELELLKRLAVPSLDAWDLRELTRAQRRLRQVFVLDPQGLLLYPGAVGEQTIEERAFIERTRSVWEGGEAFFEPEFEAGPTPAPVAGQTGSSFESVGRVWGRGLRRGASSAKPLSAATKTPHATQADYGWHTWFWGTGMHYLFWSRNHKLGRVIGAEVDRMDMLSEIIGVLPASGESTARLPTGLTRLVNARGKTAYQWGDYEPPENSEPTVRASLDAPLEMWSLQYFSAPGDLAGAGVRVRYTWALALGAVSLVLVLAAVYFYRENSRELREAGERVSFVNRVSHELKTPLTNIRMYAEMLDGNLPEEDETSRGYLDIVIQESRRLSRLITNVLAFARKQKEEVAVRTRSGDVDDSVTSVIETHRPSLTARGIEVSLKLRAGGMVLVDIDALEQILGNLVSNVEKYASAGGSLAIRTGRDGSMTWIEVTDRGPGIPAGRAAALFEPFQRLENSLTEGASGTGIGLSIARDLARAHGGDLVHKDSDGGATFRFTLHTPEVHDEDSSG